MKCGLCGHPLTVVLDMGFMALAGAFLRPVDFHLEQRFPLRLAMCEDCSSVQVADPVPPEMLYSDYFYRPSQIDTVRRYFENMARELVERFKPRTVLEIGCNDGALLRPLSYATNGHAHGVDPNAADDLPAQRVPFTASFAAEFGQFDLVVACNVFAHVHDLRDMAEGVRLSLLPNGVFVMETHYLGDLVSGCQYDAIYHEHVYYHALGAIERLLDTCGLRVFDIRAVPTHGGSMRYYIDKGVRDVSPRVLALRASERVEGLAEIETLRAFARRAHAHRAELSKLMRSVSSHTVAGYGASGRANTLIQWAGLSLDYIVDDSPARIGMFTPGSHIPVCSRAVLDRAKPDYVLALAWTYLNDIEKKVGDARLIVPFPQPMILQAARA